MEPAVRAVRSPSGPPSTRFSSFHLHARAPRRATCRQRRRCARVWLGCGLTVFSVTPVPPPRACINHYSMKPPAHFVMYGVCNTSTVLVKYTMKMQLKNPDLHTLHYSHHVLLSRTTQQQRKKERSQHSNRAAHAQLLHILIQTHFHSVVATKRGWTI